MTSQGTFTFLERLNASGRLWSLRDFRISCLVPKGKARHDFAECMRLVLTLAQKYPNQSLPRYILRAVAQFLPALLMPSQRRGRSSHFCSNARKFLDGKWESLWEQALQQGKVENAHKARELNGRAPQQASTRSRVRYAQYCARQGALSKVNQAMTSDLTPNADPVD